MPTGREATSAGLVVSCGGIGEKGRLLWVLMVTSATNRSLPGDVDLGDRYAETGLPAPSIVRTAKIPTIESVHAERIGRLGDALLQMALERVYATLHR